MFIKGHKIFGYALEEENLSEFNSWQLTQMEDVEYRIWHGRYDKRIHINRNSNNPLIYFNRSHRTFSYFSKNDAEFNGNSGPVTWYNVNSRQTEASLGQQSLLCLLIGRFNH